MKAILTTIGILSALSCLWWLWCAFTRDGIAALPFFGASLLVAMECFRHVREADKEEDVL